MEYIKFFSDISMKDAATVGGKNASLGEMITQLASLGIKVPLGFAINVQGYRDHLEQNNVTPKIKRIIEALNNSRDIAAIQKAGTAIRDLICEGTLPEKLVTEITQAYTKLSSLYSTTALDVAVRSSGTAEDLPKASFAGQQDTFLNISGIDAVLDSTKKCMASLFTDRAIVYRMEQHFDHFQVGISIGIQKMIRADKACSGVTFSLDTDTGFKDVVVITSTYGLGENIVKGAVNPDEFHVHKPTLEKGFRPIIKKYLGSKELRLIYSEHQKNSLENIPVSWQDQHRFSLHEDEILELARQTVLIEKHYSALRTSWSPMDIEWAKDGIDKTMYIVQARPETVYSQHTIADVLISYKLTHDIQAPIITKGLSIGQKIAHGNTRILKTIHEHAEFREGDILVTRMTDPDWVPLMKKAGAIITNKGGRTCHAAIVSRELGIPAIVGTGNATAIIPQGAPVTVDCSGGAIGYVYEGALPFEIMKTELKKLPHPRVPILVNIADPDSAYKHSFLPVAGVGLARLEFIITNFIKIHPMAVCALDKIKDPVIKKTIEERSFAYGDPITFYRDTLAQGIALIAAAFYPREVIVRLSDFKSNEYRNLLAGDIFEPVEENPMIGFRGAVRYCDPAYAPAFALECAAFKKVRNEMGLTNVKLMIPFVRNVYEAGCTIAALEEQGLKRGENNLQILMMCEVPSNVILLEGFSPFFDGFSIGSNDLTQLTLAVDRDSEILSPHFNETDPAVMKMFKIALESAKKTGSYMSICGEAPSDFPEIAEFLIVNGIDAISLNPDSVIPFLSRETSP